MSGLSERNPFVGPRPIQRGEALHGRDAEVRTLFNQLKARRIVVLHSPSGAGKSSLVHAGLIPRLEKDRFDVWKPIRVAIDPATLGELPEDHNRFVLSALLSLEDELPEARRRGPAELAKLGFLEYLQTRPRRRSRVDRNIVLLFDQFEEIMTVAPTAHDARQAFFDALSEALSLDSYWALFIVREDVLGALSNYASRMPTQLSNTFRLELLSCAAAEEVAVELAAQGGRSFPGVKRLIEELSTVVVVQSDGRIKLEHGESVEPVHLQVVCRRLWDALAKTKPSIEDEDVEAHASVTEALARYYAELVHTIADGDASLERTIRAWIDDRLIDGGRRARVRWSRDADVGLDDRYIQQLLDSYLVRSEHQLGANWLELGHDRLVEVIRWDNSAWDRTQLEREHGVGPKLTATWAGGPSLSEDTWLTMTGHVGPGRTPMGGPRPRPPSPRLIPGPGVQPGPAPSPMDAARASRQTRAIIEVARAEHSAGLVGLALDALASSPAESTELDGDALIDRLARLLSELTEGHDYASVSEPGRPTVVDVVVALLDLGDALRRARGPKKRELLVAAFRAGFCPEFFATGMTKHLWDIASQAEPPELRYLDELLDRQDVGSRFELRTHDLGYFSAQRLRSLGLLVIDEGASATISELALIVHEFLLAGGYRFSVR